MATASMTVGTRVRGERGVLGQDGGWDLLGHRVVEGGSLGMVGVRAGEGAKACGGVSFVWVNERVYELPDDSSDLLSDGLT